MVMPADLEAIPTTLAIRHRFLIFRMEFPSYPDQEWTFEIKFSDVPHRWAQDTGDGFDDHIWFTVGYCGFGEDCVMTYGKDYEGGSWWATLQFRL